MAEESRTEVEALRARVAVLDERLAYYVAAIGKGLKHWCYAAGWEYATTDPSLTTMCNMESQHCTERSEHDLLVTNLEDRIKDLEAKVAELKAGRDELREQIEQDAKAVTLASGERVSTAEGRRLALLLAKKLKAERDELLSLYGHAPEARCVTIGDQDHFTDECDRCGLSLGHGVHTRADGAKPSEV